MASLKQIAADIGVSHALVSRVLNNNMGTTRVSPKTRDAILARARELDYEPNPLAVALKKGRKGAVGVFLHTVGVEGSELGTRFLESAGRLLSQSGHNLWVQFFTNDEDFRRACEVKLHRKIDGLIIAGKAHWELADILAKMEEQGLPVIGACHGSMKTPGFVNFQVHELAQCYLTTQHLLELGCRKLVHLSVSPQRREGFVRAHREAALEPGRILEAANYTAEAGEQCMRQLHKAGVEGCDGIIAQSDAQAAGVLRYLSQQGLPRAQWPKVTGVDNSPIARNYCAIPLTTVSAEMETCARMAVESIMARLEGQPVESRQIQPRIIIRESTVPGSS